MVSIVASNGGSNHRINDSVGAQGQINSLLKQIKTLLKKIGQLQKELSDSNNPADRMRIIKEIIDLERTVQLLQQQIAQIEHNEQQRAKNRIDAHADMLKETHKKIIGKMGQDND